MSDLNSIEFARFKKTLDRYALQSSRTMRQVIDRTALNLSFASLEETSRADRAAIQLLGTASDPRRLVWWKYIVKKIKGTGHVIKRNTFSTSIVNGKRKRKKTGTTEIGIQGSFTRAQLSQVSKNIKASKMRAIGYIASGWLPAISKLWPLVKDKPFRRGFRDAKQFGKPNGRAYTFGGAFNPAVAIENNTDAAGRVAGPAMRRALRIVGIGMVAYMQKKMQAAAMKARRQ